MKKKKMKKGRGARACHSPGKRAAERADAIGDCAAVTSALPSRASAAKRADAIGDCHAITSALPLQAERALYVRVLEEFEA